MQRRQRLPWLHARSARLRRAFTSPAQHAALTSCTTRLW
jgi:hypothetical protein